MIAGAGSPADLAIDPRLDDPVDEAAADQQVVDPEAGIARPGVAYVVPEGEGGLVRVEVGDGVGPALGQQPGEGRAGLGLGQRVGAPGPHRVDVGVGRNDVVIAGQHGRHTDGFEARRMGEKVTGADFRAFWLR